VTAKIDIYLKSMERFGARAVVLSSDSHVMLKFAGGDRHATQTTPHDLLTDMVMAVATHGARDALDGGRETSFEYFFDGNLYRISVKPTPRKWEVMISPAGASPVEGPPPVTAPIDTVPDTVPPREHMAQPQQRQELPRSPVASVDPAAAPRPRRSTSSARWIDGVLVEMVEAGASDLHLTSGSPPYVRLHGEIQPLEADELEGAWLLEQLSEIAPEVNRAEFAERSDTDFAYNLEGVARFRVNMFADRTGPGAVLRQIPHEIPSASTLGIPDRVLELCNLSKGLVLVTGPTGSGKSTTLAALIDHINRNRAAHIITIEDPIEFVHGNKKCLINQREVHTHTQSFKAALRAALREDPDIVLVGEMRDLETIAIAVETAETGHLVFGTLHTSTAPSTVDRIIDQFPADQQEQIRQMLAQSLRGVISQTLCRRIEGGRVAAYEILLATPAVENLIRERKTFQLYSVMQTGRNVGMRTLGDSLIELIRTGVVDPREAYLKAVNKDEISKLMERSGIER
jgi:twitching motility protein PilT